MSCRYKDICPSYSGWCEGPKQDFSNCVSFLITAYENKRDELQKYKDTGLTPEQVENNPEIDTGGPVGDEVW